MEKYKLSEIADIQSGLVLSRKAAKEGKEKYEYKRLTLRSVTDEGLLDETSIEPYEASEPIDKQFLTQENDIILRLFAPVTATVIDSGNVGCVVPSQLAIIRVKYNALFTPGYLCAFLSNDRSIEAMIEGAGQAVQKIIKIGNVAEIEIPYLEIEKQKKIFKIMSEQTKLNVLYKTLIEKEKIRTKEIIKRIIGGNNG